MAEDTEVIDRIREYILKNKGLIGNDYKESQQAMNVEPSTGAVRGMAFGGDPLDPEKDKGLQDWLAKNMGPAPQIDETPAAPTAFEADKTTDSNDAGNEKVESSHPGLQSDELTPYLKGQEAQLDKWNPDKEAAVMQHLQEGYKKPGFLLAEGAAGLGDAIMQGVARAGSGNFLNTVEKNKENAIKNASDQLTHLDESNLKHMGVKQGLEAMRPGSALNKSATPVLEATLKAMGIPEADIPKFLSNPNEARKAIETLKEVIPAKDKVKIENELKIIELRMQEANLAQTHKERSTQQALEEKKNEGEAAKTLANRGVWRRLTDKISGNPATKVLESQLSSKFSPDVTSYAQRHNITPEQAQTVKDKRTRGQ